MSGVVVVTGSASGLGRTYCRELAAAGWTVVGADLHETENVALSVVTDVSDRQQTERLAVAAHDRFGRIDGLVNNAAYYTAIVKRPFEEIEPPATRENQAHAIVRRNRHEPLPARFESSRYGSSCACSSSSRRSHPIRFASTYPFSHSK